MQVRKYADHIVTAQLHLTRIGIDELMAQTTTPAHQTTGETLCWYCAADQESIGDMTSLLTTYRATIVWTF